MTGNSNFRCPPCLGRGRAWGYKEQDCPLCNGVGELPVGERDNRPKNCNLCLGRGRAFGVYEALCQVCGGYGRIPDINAQGAVARGGAHTTRAEDKYLADSGRHRHNEGENEPPKSFSEVVIRPLWKSKTGRTVAYVLALLVIAATLLTAFAKCTGQRANRANDGSSLQPGSYPSIGTADIRDKAIITAENNPTTLAGRGEPSLDDQLRLAAWIFIDGQEGEFREENGQPLIQWFTKGTVGASPTFRVEVYEPLLGDPKDFKCALQTAESPDGTSIVYAIQANDGTFEVGKEYFLLKPGENFTIRNGLNGEVVTEIPPLKPGSYGLAAGILNKQTGAEALAVTYFTVAGD